MVMALAGRIAPQTIEGVDLIDVGRMGSSKAVSYRMFHVRSYCPPSPFRDRERELSQPPTVCESQMKGPPPGIGGPVWRPVR